MHSVPHPVGEGVRFRQQRQVCGPGKSAVGCRTGVDGNGRLDAVGADHGTLALDAALDALTTAFVSRNPASLKHFEQQVRDMPGGNSRSVLFYASFPLTMASGCDAELTDLDGQTYREFIAEYTAGVYGHSAPEIRDAVLAAMDPSINLTGHNVHEDRLAQLIC